MKKPSYISTGYFSTNFFEKTIRSKHYDDIYFSPENGEAESEYVFLKANKLQERFSKISNFTIAELGFGTGLNFLLTWKLFNNLNNEGYLDFISIEGYPLKENILNKIYGNNLELKNYWDELRDALPPLWPGVHRLNLQNGRVRLTLIYEEVLNALARQNFEADAWFLDGFNPNKNSEMWSEEVMKEVFRLTKPSGTFSTFSSAGFVRRNLERAGFEVHKIKGFRSKKEMSVGKKVSVKKTKNKFLKFLIIGGGIAGVSIAHSLNARGYSPTIVDKYDKLAQGASGNLAAVQYPRLTTVDTAAGRLSLACYRYSRFQAKKLNVALNDKSIIFGIPEREEKKQKIILSQGWSSDLVRELNEEDKAEIFGGKINLNGVVHDYGGTIKPSEFVNKLVDDSIEKIFGVELIDIQKHINGWKIKLSNNEEIITEVLILACSEGLNNLRQTSVFNLQYTQGQVTHLDKSKFKDLPKSNLSFSGYLTPPINNIITIGATFEKNSTKRTKVSVKANEINLSNIPDEIYNNILISEKIDAAKLDGRVSMRVSTYDRMPMMGSIDENLFILSALGARGMIMGPLLGDALVSIILNQPIGLDNEILRACDPNRIERSFLV